MSTRTDINKLYEILEQKGYMPLFTNYLRSKDRLFVKCKKHGNFQTTGQLIKRGNGCRKCGREKYSKTRRGSIERVSLKAKQLGIRLISKKFPNLSGYQVLEFECDIHGIFEKEHTQVMRGRGCPRCGHERAGLSSRKDPNTFATQIKQKWPEYKLESEYENNKTKVIVSCKKHGQFFVLPCDLLSGHGCGMCGNRRLKTQMDISNFVKSYGFLVKDNDRNVIKPIELDIYIPSKNIAIEYCGIHWHTENKRNKNLHYNKYLACKNKNIQLITIFSDEWLEKEDRVRNILKAKLSILPKIFARNCDIKEITKEIAKPFVDKYHLQGYAKSKINLGLFFNEELVGVITGGRHHRDNSENSIVLNRLCFGPYSVIGGSGKLFKYFKEKVISLNFKKIISWSDNRWSNGAIYEKLNFLLDKEMKKDYSYCKGKKRFSKQSCQKKKLIKKGGIGNTERELALSLGLERIWDCGKKRWIYNIP